MEKEVKTIEPEVSTKSHVVEQIKTTDIVVKEIDAQKVTKHFHSFSIISQGFQGRNPKYKGVMLRGTADYMVLDA